MRKAITFLLVVALVVGVYYAYSNNWFALPVAAPAVSPEVVVEPGIPGAADPGIPANATQAVVEYVHDGDTLFLADGRKVRLLGINTPEIGKNAECYGEEATAELRGMLPEGTPVWVAQDVEPLDQYGRSLLFIYTDAAVNVNLALLRSGAAEVEMYSPNLMLQAEVGAAEADARAAGLGLWGVCR